MPAHIDLSYIERLYKGDRARVEQWIRLYLEEAPTLFGQLRTAIVQGDVPGLIAASHDLRPQAHYLGTPQLLELLVAIGEHARSDGAPACAQLVDKVLALGDGMALELQAVIVPQPNTKPV